MARINLHSGDAGDLPVTFQGGTRQQAVTFANSGVLTLSTTDCHVYVYDGDTGVELTKVANGTPPQNFTVNAGQNYDVMVVGTTAAKPSGVIHYSFA